MASSDVASHEFHEGERAVQSRAGVADIAARAGRGIHAAMPQPAQAFLAEQLFAVVASGSAPGPTWVSLVAGTRGFLRAPNAHTVEIESAPRAGDPLALALKGAAPVGLLAIDLATRRRLRVNGVVERARGPIRIRVSECFSTCPKYIQRRDLAPPASNAEASAPTRRTAALSLEQQARIARADTFFIGSRHAGTGLDASHRGGRPGFVEIRDARRLAWPDYAGNAMFQTLGNLATDPHAGLLFVDFESGDLLQLTGRARVDFDPARAARHAGAERVVDFEVHTALESHGVLPLRAGVVEPSPFNPRGAGGITLGARGPA